MEELWLKYGATICRIVFYSFGLIWFSLNWYIFACYKMSKYKEQIDENGGIVNSDINFPFWNPFKIRYLFIRLPTIESGKRYYKHPIFKKQSELIKSYRKIYRIVFPLYILILIPLTIYFLTKYN